jgi:hypothetical protein
MTKNGPFPSALLEINFEDLASVLEVSPRTARRLVKSHPTAIQPIRYGYRTFRFALRDAVKFKKFLRRNAITCH